MYTIRSGFYKEPDFLNAFLALQKQVYPWLNLSWEGEQSGLTDITTPFGLYIRQRQDNHQQALSILTTTLMDLTIDSKPYTGLQIGTVATHPDYRNQGLSKKLLEHAIAHFSSKIDFVFLFANEQAVGFYKKLGFSPAQETQYLLTCSAENKKSYYSNLKQLELNEQTSAIQHIYTLLSQRSLISNQFDSSTANPLRYFYLSMYYQHAIWWDECHNLLIVAEPEGSTLVVYDIIGLEYPADYLTHLNWPGITTLDIRFTPDRFIGDFTTKANFDEGLMLMLNQTSESLCTAFKSRFKVPALIHT